ncbi:hypothetical protein [Oricola cellulosilytica]|uniref:Tyr recombinase domain-containing protein n=1 Tax=Oricola cellulosilytica TaxID=1429082 RepID=A0A4R0PHZ1_9HYPH|nr:hypothetical protein [Oricola cellulosilytica]TCD15174.1 hypothetical protein E0D97_06390 [Oricola cellulosilytica]
MHTGHAAFASNEPQARRLRAKATTMGTITIRIPLVTWRDGRPRFFASAAQRRLGFAGEDLRHGGDGPWFTVEECRAWSEAKQADIAAARSAAAATKPHGEELTAAAFGKRRRVQPARSLRANPTRLTTLSQLVEGFLDRDPRNKGREIVEGRKRRKPRAADTVRFYRSCAAALAETEADHGWHRPAAALAPADLGKAIERVEIARGLSTARGVRAMLSQAFAWAVREGLARANPVALIEDRLPVPEERVRVGTVAEMLALTAAADALGRPEAADCIWLALFSAQRQKDRLALEERQFGADGILWQQSKTGERLLIPQARIVRERFAAARERRKGWKVVPTRVIVDERAQRPFKADWWRKVFREVRDHAAASMPSLSDFRDQDLRDTALSWADYAGCDYAEIGNLSGHRFARETQILRHYVTKFDPARAARAVAKTEAWFDRQVEAEKEKAL